MVLGVFPNAIFSAATLKLVEGDSPVVFSDGIIEAQNADDQYFGQDRLIKVLRQCAGRSAEEICTRIMEAVTEFVGQVPQSDDLLCSCCALGGLEEIEASRAQAKGVLRVFVIVDFVV